MCSKEPIKKLDVRKKSLYLHSHNVFLQQQQISLSLSTCLSRAPAVFLQVSCDQKITVDI